MPLRLTPQRLVDRHPSRPLPWLPWIASSLFVIGLLGVVATLIAVVATSSEPGMNVRVVDAGTGEALAGAVVTVGGTPYVTDEDGSVSLPNVSSDVALLVSHDGYLAKGGNVAVQDGSASFQVSLRESGESPSELASAAPQTLAANQSQTAAETAQTDAPASPQPTAASQSVATPAASDATPAAPAGELAGTVTDGSGAPVQGALITDGKTVEVTGADGLFSVKAQSFVSDTLRVSAPGFADATLSFAQTTRPLTLTLEKQPIKGIYYNPNISNTPEDVDRLIDIINTTEANAIVIDVKEELVFYDTQVQFFRDVDTVRPIIDLPALLARMKENHIYTIARHVVFKDGLVAERRPDLAVLNSVTGEVWRDQNGVAWVNPMVHDLWDANIALSVELAQLGFDEIQYDYVRFPTDGDLSTMDFGLPYNEENRVTAISKFMERSKQALLPTGAKLSADVFGFTVLVPDDLGIGQDITVLAPFVDYFSPMVYPSHFPDGAMGLAGHPNDYPYETIEMSMSAGKSQLGSALKLRPWLQDFDFFDMLPYGTKEVRAQIDAAEDVGTSGWLLWDPNNAYTLEALGPDDGNMKRFEAPVALLPGSGTVRMLTRRQAA